MPSGRTHDAVTFLLAAPAFAACYSLTGNAGAAGIMGLSFIFGGIMFGPDLDTVSRQYSRWGVFRFLWLPYRSFFKHRSRFSHGLIFGALLRVIYFLGAVSLAAFAAAYLAMTFSGGTLPNVSDVTGVWAAAGGGSRRLFGEYLPASIFAGLWFGAASHTFTDMAGSFIKTGRIAKFL